MIISSERIVKLSSCSRIIFGCYQNQEIFEVLAHWWFLILLFGLFWYRFCSNNSREYFVHIILENLGFIAISLDFVFNVGLLRFWVSLFNLIWILHQWFIHFVFLLKWCWKYVTYPFFFYIIFQVLINSSILRLKFLFPE